MSPTAERTMVSFADPAAFEAWLEEHHTQPTGVWLQIGKKGAAPSVTYAQALDVALCWGWIDGQKAKLDEVSWLQYFCPRRKGSVWSQVNQGHVARLTAEGRMRPPGLAAIEDAKRTGQWDKAYQPTSSQDVPPALALALDQNPQAKAFFDTLDRQNRFAFIFRSTTPKKEQTRLRKVEEFVRMLEAGEVFFPKP